MHMTNVVLNLRTTSPAMESLFAQESWSEVAIVAQDVDGSNPRDQLLLGLHASVGQGRDLALPHASILKRKKKVKKEQLTYKN